MSKTIAVTGGTGYIAEFLDHGYSVRASMRSLLKTEDLKKLCPVL